MKNLPMPLNHRNRERGAVALMIAVMWTALFGMAVMAVDFGYLYTKKRGLQSTADGALKAAMPEFKVNGATAAQNRARQVAQLSGYQNSEITFPSPGAANQFKVTITRSHPTFFGGVFGIGSKDLSASATGELTALASGPAIYAGDPSGCGGQWDLNTGLDIRGNGYLKVNGDVQTRNKFHLGAANGSCNNPTLCQITGTVTTGAGCTFWNDGPVTPPGNVIVGAPTTGAPPDPIAVAFGTFNAQCTVGDMGAVLVGGIPFGPEAGGCNPIPIGIYCSSDPIDVIPPGPSGSICPSVVSFFSNSGVSIQTNGAVTLTAHPLAPQGVIVYSNQGIGFPVAFRMTAGAGGLVTLNGKIYAPNGLVDFQTDTSNLVVGSTVAGRVVNISLGNGASWTFNGPGSVVGSGWRVYR